jgi:hypothetical protein
VAPTGYPSTATTKTYTAKADGAWYFHVRAVDRAGNWGATSTREVRIDTVAPSTTFVRPVDSATYSQASTVTCEWTCGDSNAGVAGSSATLDGSPIASGAAIDTLVTGTHTFAVTATDGAGNAATKSVTYAVDPLTFTITPSAGAGGGITPATPQIVASGADQAFTITPATGYHVADVLVDGSSVGAVTSYNFTNVTADHTISASFAIETFTITPSAGAHGSITPATAQTVDYGSSQSFTITPAAGYHVADVLVDGTSVGALTSRTFTNVTADHTIAASFAIDTYTITPSAGAHGSISPATPQTVDYGADQAFLFTPATGYHVAGVLVDGTSVGALTSYNFTNVSADHTIAASFAAGVPTRLAVSVAKTVVSYGSGTLLRGRLYDSGDPLHEVGMGGQLVTVQSAAAATGPWVNVETLTTSSVDGSVGKCTLSITPTRPTYYRLRFVAGPASAYGDSLSVVVRVGVRPAVSTPKVRRRVRAGRSFTVYGTLKPHFPAGQKTVKVKIYRYKNRRWVYVRRVAATNVDFGTYTKYKAKLRFTTKGKYRFRAYTVATAIWAGDTTGLSTVLTVK